MSDLTNVTPVNVASGSTEAANIASVANTNIGTQSLDRVYPRQLSTGSLRGTQTVGYGGVKIDGSNNQITIGTTTNSIGQKQETVIGQLNPSNPQDPSFGLKVVDSKGAQLLFGILPDGNLGIELIDASGNEVMRSGLLPLAQIYGWATATPGNTLQGQV